MLGWWAGPGAKKRPDYKEVFDLPSRLARPREAPAKRNGRCAGPAVRRHGSAARLAHESEALLEVGALQTAECDTLRTRCEEPRIELVGQRAEIPVIEHAHTVFPLEDQRSLLVQPSRLEARNRATDWSANPPPSSRYTNGA